MFSRGKILAFAGVLAGCKLHLQQAVTIGNVEIGKNKQTITRPRSVRSADCGAQIRS